jgi:peptidoglycan/LPS O-acetylase OafA/YrhL
MTTLSSPPDFTRRIPQLDGLRGVAIAMVLAFHYGANIFDASPQPVRAFLRITGLGWSGVDLFFVLSGLLIGGILMDARESSNYFRVFYRRRICRIFPLYFAFLAFVFLPVHFQSDIPWRDCVFFYQNFWMAIHNRFGDYILCPTWSLAVEEQFYLTLPALIYFVRPSRLIRMVIGGIILAPLIRLAMFMAHPQLTTALYVLLPCRMNALLLGVAAAYYLRQDGAWEFVLAHRRQLWIAIAVLTIVCSLFLIRPSLSAPLNMLLGYDCLALLFVSILVASLFNGVIARALQTKWLIALGGISYCVYLIHQFVFGLTSVFLGDLPYNWLFTPAVALALTVVIAKMSWEYFEKPLVKLGHREHYELPATRATFEVPVAETSSASRDPHPA